jgi:protein-L-isoaspartate O-methyltransferase
VSERLVAAIEQQFGPIRPRHRAAFLAVDRGRFVRPVDRAFADQNTGLPLDTPHGEPVPPLATLLADYGSPEAVIASGRMVASGATISQPAAYALAFALLDLDQGDRYLELGTGSGYGSALAREIVGPTGRVVSVDVDPHLVERARALSGVDTIHDDGLARGDLLAEANKCWITFSVERLPAKFLNALGGSAKLLVPFGAPPPAMQQLTLLGRSSTGAIAVERVVPGLFMPGRPLIVAPSRSGA